MARSIRIEYAGAFYHVMARGNRREAIFLDDVDREFFLRTLGEACAMTGWRVHAWVLMGNHYHLLIETPEANLVAGMQWLQNAYTRRFNTRHQLWGRLFGDRYKAVPVESAGGHYYSSLLDYIHLNPVRAGLVRVEAKESVLDYKWSSVSSGYAVLAPKRMKWLAAEAGLAEFGLKDTVEGRRRFVRRLDERACAEKPTESGLPPLEAEVDGRLSHLRRGWYWGSQEFAERLLKLGGEVIGKKRERGYQYSAERRAHDEGEAERLLKTGLAAAGMGDAEVEQLPGADARKVAIANWIWSRTAVSQVWIAERLGMTSAANVSYLIRRWKQRKKKPKLPVALAHILSDHGA